MASVQPISTEYASLQRQFYDDRIRSLSDAQNLVGCYREGLAVMPSILQFVLDEYRQRRRTLAVAESRLLDFGCGVGRIMQAARTLGFRHTDGVDISPSMLAYARENPALSGARFFLNNGADCGEAPRDHYQLVTSFFCLQHVCHHGNRMRILRAMSDCLADDGMVALELQYFPTITTAEIPPSHAPWGEHRVATVTNSEADVWITPDRLGHVLADVASCFHDVSFQLVELFETHEYDRASSTATTNYAHPFQHLYVFGTKRRSLSASIYRELSEAGS